MLDLLYAEVNKIQDPATREYVTKIVESAPENSWKLPSSRDHHLRDERGDWGNLYHTVRVTRICDTLADILDLGQGSKDILRAAAVLHDVCKHGIDAEAVFIYKEHPHLVKGLVEKLGLELDIEVNNCIEHHMGRWGKAGGWTIDSQINLPFLLHLADCIEARLPDLGIRKPEKVD